MHNNYEEGYFFLGGIDNGAFESGLDGKPITTGNVGSKQYIYYLKEIFNPAKGCLDKFYIWDEWWDFNKEAPFNPDQVQSNILKIMKDIQ